MDASDISQESYDAGEAALEGYPIAEVDRLDAASDVLHAGVPIAMASELRRLADVVSHGATRVLLLNRANAWEKFQR